MRRHWNNSPRHAPGSSRPPTLNASDWSATSTTALAAARAELDHALAELRELARGLHPAILTDRGLEPALNALAGRAPVPVELRVTLDRRLPETIEATAYYLVAEALTNVAKYAYATHVTVAVEMNGTDAAVTITDDGTGGAQHGEGTGLRGLTDRVAAIGGHLDIHSPPGGGTRLHARMPLTAT
jgi:signal transduction histidine kinase